MLSFVHCIMKIDGLVYLVMNNYGRHRHPVILVSFMRIAGPYVSCFTVEDLEKLTPTSAAALRWCLAVQHSSAPPNQATIHKAYLRTSGGHDAH